MLTHLQENNDHASRNVTVGGVNKWMEHSTSTDAMTALSRGGSSTGGPILLKLKAYVNNSSEARISRHKPPRNVFDNG